MKKLLALLMTVAPLLLISAQAEARSSHARYSHQGGYYKGGHGSSHKGGHYVNRRTGNHYTRHR